MVIRDGLHKAIHCLSPLVVTSSFGEYPKTIPKQSQSVSGPYIKCLILLSVSNVIIRLVAFLKLFSNATTSCDESGELFLNLSFTFHTVLLWLFVKLMLKAQTYSA